MNVHKLIASYLVFSLALQPLLPGLMVFAEEQAESSGGSVRRLNRRSAPAAEGQAQEAQASGAAASSQSRTESGNASQAAPASSNQRVLTTLGSGKQTGAEKEQATAVSSQIAVQDTGWREELDILSPDDTSPVLAESVFGNKGKQRINLVADNVEIKNIMDHLATEYRLNIVAKEIGNNNRIKTSLYDIPLETVFQVLLEQANLSYEKRNSIIYLQDRGRGTDYFLEERFFKLKPFADFDFAGKLIDNIATSRGKKILPNPDKKTYFVVEYKANLERMQKTLGDLGYLEEIDPDSSVLSHHYLAYNYIDSKVVEELIKKHQAKDGKYIQDAKSNRFIVFDTRANFELMQQALDFVDVPPGQVFVDVKFLDLNDEDTRRLGMSQTIDWNGSANDQDKFSFSLAADVTRALNWQVSPVVNLGMSGNHDLLNTKIINNPKVMVMNNDTANIQVTENFPYVTNENSNGVISSKINQVPIGVQLNVTPRINANGEVQMTLEPKVTVLKDVKIITTKVVDTNQAGGRTTETDSEFPIIDERSIKTNVAIPNGKTLIIGGLIKESDRKGVDQVPGLTKLPLLGRFFRRTTDAEVKSQLYIFITPTIVKQAPVTSVYKAAATQAPLMTSLSSESRTTGAAPVAGLSLSSAESNADKPKASPREKVDFSSFLQKVNALREKERGEKLRASDVQAKEVRKQQGFDSLIDQLKQDLTTANASGEQEPQVNQTSAAPVTAVSAPLIPKDRILGERAERIANLLKAWEKNPVDGVMKPVQKAEDPVDLRPRTPAAPLDDKPPALSDDIGQAPQRVSVAAPEVKKIEVTAPVTTSEELSAPVVEDPITTDFFSPLGRKPQDKPTSQNNRFLRFGDINGAKDKSTDQTSIPEDTQASQGEEPATEAAPTQSESQPAAEETTSDPSESSRPTRRKRVGFFEEPVDMQNLLPMRSQPKPVKVAEDSSNRTFEYTLARKEEVQPESGNETSGDWIENFLQNDLARIVVSQLEENEEEDVVPVAKTITPAKVVEPAAVAVEVSGNQKPEPAPAPAIVAAKEPVRPLRPMIQSSDATTQAVFDQLLNPTGSKPLSAKATAPAVVSQKARPAQVKTTATDVDFEAFLNEMFQEEEVVQAVSVSTVVVETTPKLPPLPASAERDFLQFLGNF